MTIIQRQQVLVVKFYTLGLLRKGLKIGKADIYNFEDEQYTVDLERKKVKKSGEKNVKKYI